MLTDWRFRLRALFSRTAVERELDDELRFHFEQHVEQHMNTGLDREEAVRRARLAFGGLDQIKEECRDARGIHVIEELWRDLSYGLRMLRRRMLLSAAAIATLAIGIGLNAAVFSVVDWVLLRPLAYPSSHELVKVVSSGSSPAGAGSLTYAEFESLSTAPSLRASAAFSTATRVIAGAGAEPAHIVVARLAGDLFGTLNVYPTIGRAFTNSEAASSAPFVVLSETLWRRRWSADPGVVGKLVTIDGQSHTVVGIMPEGRGYPHDADVWRPLTPAEREDDDREYVMIARLASGISADRANLEIATLASAGSPGTISIWAEGLQRAEARDVRTALVALLASTGIILLIACANVAALLGARSADRLSEFGVRSALGASRARLLRQLLTEAVLLAVVGGAAGLVLGRWALDLLVNLAPAGMPRLEEITLDMRIVAIGAVATFVVGLIVALAPVRSISQCDLRGGTAALGVGRASRRTAGRRTLVAAQAAMAIVLTVGAGLLGRSLQHLVSIDHGFTPDRLVAIQLTLRGTVTADSSQLFGDLIESAEAVPGVHSAAAAMRLPNQLTYLRVPVDVIGRPPGSTATVTLRPVTPGYFGTVGIPLLAGRNFGREDRRSAPRVAVVNTAFVREVLRGGSAIGTRLRTEMFDGESVIVGEVANVTPAGEADRPALYVSTEQLHIGGGGSLLVRMADSPQAVLPALVSRLRRVAPNLAFDRVDEVAELLASGRAATRFNMRLVSAFALLALLLAAVGVYGLTAAEVVSRWRELGVRLALGATRCEALWTVMRSSAMALSIGIAVGLIIAAVVAHGMKSLLLGVGPTDGVVLVSAPMLFVIIGLAASALAALRVLKADPAAILRVE
jgi:predicted permease